MQSSDEFIQNLMLKPSKPEKYTKKTYKIEQPVTEVDNEEPKIQVTGAIKINDMRGQKTFDRANIVRNIRNRGKAPVEKLQVKSIIQKQTSEQQNIEEPEQTLIKQSEDIDEKENFKLVKEPEERNVATAPRTVSIKIDREKLPGEPEESEAVKEPSKRKKSGAVPVERLPLTEIPQEIAIKAEPFYLNNREMFIRDINIRLNKVFSYLDTQESSVVSCDVKSNDKFDLLTHQKIVKYYINLFSPYRGILLYHGLGAGKTCSSIAIAEGMKTYKRVLVMTPASLRMNYIEELKKCGDPLYKREQFWEFVNVKTQPEMINIMQERR